MELKDATRFIAIGAHCDDVDLRVGGTFSRLVRGGARGCYVVASENVYTHPGFPRRSSRGVLARRRAEATQAAGILGANRVEFLELKSYYFTREDDPYSRVFPTFSTPENVRDELEGMILDGLPPLANAISYPQCVERLSALLVEVKPEVVFTHSPDDYHPDHYAVARFVAQVLRERAAGSRPVLYFWEPGSGSPIATFAPDVFVELSDEDVALKQRALDGYVSQFPAEVLDGFAERRAGAYGSLAGVRFAEGFRRAHLGAPERWADGTDLPDRLCLRPSEPVVWRLS